MKYFGSVAAQLSNAYTPNAYMSNAYTSNANATTSSQSVRWWLTPITSLITANSSHATKAEENTQMFIIHQVHHVLSITVLLNDTFNSITYPIYLLCENIIINLRTLFCNIYWKANQTKTHSKLSYALIFQLKHSEDFKVIYLLLSSS